MRWNPRTGFAALLLLAVTSGAQGAAPGGSGESRLDAIRARGFLRVGTTGDFRPFTHRDETSGDYSGFDIEAARMLGVALGVEVRFIPTTWSTLVDGISEDRYDLAMGGITRTVKRQMDVGISDPYIEVGKVALIRKADQERFPSIEAIDQPGVTIGVNPGGTNEAFVRANVTRAKIVVNPDNLAIPGQVRDGTVDVMFTDNIEALLAVREHPQLAIAPGNALLTHDDFGYLYPRGDVAFGDVLNLWIHQMRQHGEFGRLRRKWIGE